MGSGMIYRSLAETPADFGPCAITIGNFDGVHCGHRRDLRQVVALPREDGWKPAVAHLRSASNQAGGARARPRLLTTPEQRAA